MESSAASLIAVITSLIAIVSGFVAYSTKQASTYQGMVVSILKEQIATVQTEKAALIVDNKAQAVVIGKLGVSVDKLTEQGSDTIRLLEDVVYGREHAQQARRRTT